jgi:hypothetical protein
MTQNAKWTLDRNLSVGMIAAVLFQVGAFIWFGAKLDSRVVVLEDAGKQAAADLNETKKLTYVIQAFCLALGVHMMMEGFRKIQVNRVKQKIATENLVEKRLQSIEIQRDVKAYKESLKEDTNDVSSAV